MTYEDLLRTMLDRVPGNVDKREGSIIYDALAPCAYFLAQQNFQLENYMDLVFPDTAVGEYLDRAVAAFGVTRKKATAASRRVEASGAVPIGSRWGINGLVYTIAGVLTEGAEYRAECETPGDVGNQYSGSILPISDITGVTANLGDIIAPGVDEETDDALRARFQQKVQMPATSGNAYHYRLWAMEVPGCGDAKVFPLDNGPGTVTVLVVDKEKQVDQGLPAVVADYIETVRPIGASVKVASPAATTVGVSAGIILDGSAALGTVLAEFKNSLGEYLGGLVFTDYRVSYARVGSILLSTWGVADYNDLRLNGTSANIIIPSKSVPVAGPVTLSEVSTLGTL